VGSWVPYLSLFNWAITHPKWVEFQLWTMYFLVWINVYFNNQDEFFENLIVVGRIQSIILISSLQILTFFVLFWSNEEQNGNNKNGRSMFVIINIQPAKPLSFFFFSHSKLNIVFTYFCWRPNWFLYMFKIYYHVSSRITMFFNRWSCIKLFPKRWWRIYVIISL